MEDWDLVDVKDLKCGSDTDKVTMITYSKFKILKIIRPKYFETFDTLQEVCLCGAQFSLQALVGTPLWICEPCEMWKN